MKFKDSILRDILAYVFGTIMLCVVVPAIIIVIGIYYPIDFMPLNKTTSAFGAVCSGCGLFFVIWANYEMVTKGKGGAAVIGKIKLSHETQHLVTTGPYSLCRNPMHMGLVLFYLGLCCAINSLITLIIPLAFLTFAYIMAKYVDEPRLKRDFPNEFDDWCHKVPQRFWPKPKKG